MLGEVVEVGALAPFLLLVAGEGAGGGGARAGGGGGAARLGAGGGARAVSYTHLDVYKRQIEPDSGNQPVFALHEGIFTINENGFAGRSVVVGIWFDQIADCIP